MHENVVEPDDLAGSDIENTGGRFCTTSPRPPPWLVRSCTWPILQETHITRKQNRV